MRLVAAAAALALFVLVRSTTGVAAVADAALVGLLLAALAIAGLWRWLAAAAGCAFLVVYAAALLIERGPARIGSALGVGLAVVVLLESVDLAARMRGATVQGAVVVAALGRLVALGIVTLLAATGAMALATVLATGVPAGAAPLLAAAGALGSVWVLAALFRRAR